MDFPRFFFLLEGFAKRGKEEMKAECSPFYSLPNPPNFWQLIFCDMSFSHQNSQGYDQANICTAITIFYLSSLSIAITKTNILLKIKQIIKN